MKISRDAWHYRLMDQFNFYHPRNLCQYFWMTVWCLLVGLGIFFFGLMIVFLAIIPLWWWSEPTAPLGLLVAVGVIEISLLSVLLGNVVIERHEREIENGTRREPEIKLHVQKEPSLLRLWLRAKHEKICPLIEFHK